MAGLAVGREGDFDHPESWSEMGWTGHSAPEAGGCGSDSGGFLAFSSFLGLVLCFLVVVFLKVLEMEV